MPPERETYPCEVEDRGDVILVRFTGGTFAVHETDAQALACQLDLIAERAHGRNLILDFSGAATTPST